MGGFLTLLVAVALVAGCALPLTWSMRIRGAAALVAALVVAAAEIVLLMIALSLADALQVGWMLLGEALLAVVAIAVWQRAGRPRPPLRGSLPSRRAAREWARANPAATGMAAVAAAALALQLVMALAVAPNNWDSMTYHLARIGYWLQFDSVRHFDDGTIRQLANPPNGEYLQGWTMLLSGGDRFANAVQWVTLVGLAAAIGGMARALGFSRAAALFAASLFVAMPQPILQAASTQNDLIVSFFVVAALLFGLRGLRDRSTPELALFGAALGLAVGTKGTALLAVPGIGLVLAVAAWRYSAPAGVLLRATAAAAAGVIVLGSFNYALNLDAYGDPLGDLPKLTERQSPVGENAVRAGWTLVDSTGVSMPWLDVGLRRPVNKLLGDVRTPDFAGYSIDTGVQEDTSAFGLLGLLALIVLAVALVARRTPWDRRAVAAAALAYLALFLVVNEYNPWVARLMMPALAIGAPLLALLYRRGWTRGTAVALALLSLLPSLFVNPLKPLFVEPAAPTVFALDRIEQQTLVRPDVAPALRELDTRLPADAPIGFVGNGDSWDYPFFGEGLERRVVPLAPSAASRDTMRRESLRGIVFANTPPPRGLDAEQLAPGYWLAVRQPRARSPRAARSAR